MMHAGGGLTASAGRSVAETSPDTVIKCGQDVSIVADGPISGDQPTRPTALLDPRYKLQSDSEEDIDSDDESDDDFYEVMHGDIHTIPKQDDHSDLTVMECTDGDEEVWLQCEHGSVRLVGTREEPAGFCMARCKN